MLHWLLKLPPGVLVWPCPGCTPPSANSSWDRLQQPYDRKKEIGGFRQRMDFVLWFYRTIHPSCTSGVVEFYVFITSVLPPPDLFPKLKKTFSDSHPAAELHPSFRGWGSCCHCFQSQKLKEKLTPVLNLLTESSRVHRETRHYLRQKVASHVSHICRVFIHSRLGLRWVSGHFFSLCVVADSASAQRGGRPARAGRLAQRPAGPPDDSCWHGCEGLCCWAAVCALQGERYGHRSAHGFISAAVTHQSQLTAPSVSTFLPLAVQKHQFCLERKTQSSAERMT